VVTRPDSKNRNPAAIHMTKKPQTKKENVLNIYATSASTSALTEELSNKIKERIVKRLKNFLYIINSI